MKRKNEDEEEMDMSKAAKLDPPPEEVKNNSSIEIFRPSVHFP